MRTHSLIALALLTVAPVAAADNFAECLLDNLPGVRNRPTTLAALNLCRGKYPGAFGSVPQGAGRGFFAKFDSGGECTLELGRDITDQQGAFLVAKACKLLYDEPNPFNDPGYGSLIPYDGPVIHPAKKQPGLFDDLEFAR